MRNSREREGSAEAAALALVQQHAGELLRFAGRFSHCADDAHDAYQRAIEILVRRLRSEPPTQPLPWIRTVLRHEALAIRAEREQLVGRVEVELDRHEDRHVADPAEQAVGHERLRHTAEALRRLKPQEVTALVLRAEGLSYREICTRTGWTYTRTNRAVTEGRRALLERLGAIESGAECARWLPLLSALADGEATAADLAELRLHLRSCPACRATLRDCHAAPAHVAALVPAALLPLAVASDGTLAGHVELSLHGLLERATLLAARMQGAFEAMPGAKLAAVAASTAALAGGGAAIEQAAQAGHVSRGVAQAAVAPAPGGLRLLSIASPLDSASRPAGATRRASGRPRASEFASSPGGPLEFASGAAAPAEFASDRATQASVASAAPTRAPSAPASAPAFGTPPTSSEFSGP
jgi:RNA polymerase sigma factor (sigma-70 family)